MAVGVSATVSISSRIDLLYNKFLSVVGCLLQRTTDNGQRTTELLRAGSRTTPIHHYKESDEQLVTTPDELAACCKHLAACRYFGFDTEFVGEDTYHPSLCLLQAASPERLFLIDPLSVGPLDAFWELVVDPANLVVVHAGREEVRLCHIWSGRTPGNLFDLQIAAGLVGLTYPLGHGTLVSQLLRVQLAKGETLTEWRTRPLTRAQIRYAFDDVRYLLPLWQKLSSRLEKLNRADWAREEFGRLTTNATPEEPGSISVQERWRKLRGLGSLDRRRLAIVRELYAWREEMAARCNRPARTIVRDDLLVEIARRNPTRERDLHVVRGLPRRDLEAILKAVERARTLAPEECPIVTDREQDPPQVTWMSNVLLAALGDLCVRQHLAPNLVASTLDVKLLVRARLQRLPFPAESLLTRGWRATHILPQLEALLDGRQTLRIANVHAEAPFAFAEDERNPPV
jgi:ribonuclease D